MARLVLENVSKVFTGAKGEPVWAVKDLSLAVADREFLVLVGPSGSGKSTILRLIAGLDPVTAGTIALDGRVVHHLEPRDRDVAMVFQNHALYPHLTVAENLGFGLKLRKFPRAEIAHRVRAAAETLGLLPVLDRLPRALSGGQRQRVAVGRAIVRQPKAFLFDEPLSNLDAPLRSQMRIELRKLHAQLGATTLYVTHDQAEAMTMGQRVVVLKEGVVQQVAAPLELYRRPANLFVAEFIGSPPINVFRGRLEAGAGALRFRWDSGDAVGSWLALTVRLPAIPSRLPDYVGRPIVLGLRPESIVRVPSHPDAADGACEAAVEWVEPLGAETHVHATFRGGRFVARWSAEEDVAPGDAVRVRFMPEGARFFDPATERAVD